MGKLKFNAQIGGEEKAIELSQPAGNGSEYYFVSINGNYEGMFAYGEGSWHWYSKDSLQNKLTVQDLRIIKQKIIQNS